MKGKKIEELQKSSSKRGVIRENAEKVADATKGITLITGFISSAIALGMYLDDHIK